MEANNAQPGGEVVPVEVAYRLAERSKRLRRRRFEMLPLRGAGSAFSEPQGRNPGDSLTPTGLQELISSISTIGVLQPILVEVLPQGARRLVAGERRLAAARWIAVNLPDNPHAEAIPAVVCEGPLSEEERRIWQLIENLARSDLQPGELAAALLYERSAVLVAKLLAHGVAVPEHVATLDDPIARFEGLDRLRRAAGLDHVGAPWGEVLKRLGLQLSPDKARKLVAALRALPAELSADMDAHDVALHTRLSYLKLHRGRRDAAKGIWAAVKARGRPDLLTRALIETTAHPHSTPDQATEAAAAFHHQANHQRATTLRAHRLADSQQGPPRLVADELVASVRAGLAELLQQLHMGASLTRYDAGSLRLATDELREHLSAL